MKSLARKFLVWILLALAFVLESFWSIVGLGAITYGVALIYAPAGWITGGLALVAISEFPNGFQKIAKPRVNGANSGVI